MNIIAKLDKYNQQLAMINHRRNLAINGFHCYQVADEIKIVMCSLIGQLSGVSDRPIRMQLQLICILRIHNT